MFGLPENAPPEYATAALINLDLILKVLIALVGLYLAHSLGRQVALRVTEKRLAAYAKLWALTGMASPVRLLYEGAGGGLNRQERLDLHDKLANWYYADGNGMLLANGTRTMFLSAKDNLVFDPDSPPKRDAEEPTTNRFEKEISGIKDRRERETRHGKRAIQQLSLLRTRMKADLGVFGVHYGGTLKQPSKDFLKDCGENLRRRPWRRSVLEYLKSNRAKKASQGAN